MLASADSYAVVNAVSGARVLSPAHDVPVPEVLEGVRVRKTSIWGLPARTGQSQSQVG